MPESSSSFPRLPARLDRIVSYFVIPKIPKTDNHAAQAHPREMAVFFSFLFFLSLMTNPWP